MAAVQYEECGRRGEVQTSDAPRMIGHLRSFSGMAILLQDTLTIHHEFRISNVRPL